MKSPATIAKLAADIYAIEKERHLPLFLKKYNFLSCDKSVNATTGWLIKKDRLFSICAMDKTTGTLYIIFRGTKYLSDWFTDVQAGLAPSDGGHLVHKGFNDTFNSCKNELSNYLKQQSDVKNVVCIGHSLGGALANLTALWVSAKGYSVNLFTFGAPRVGHSGHGFGDKLTVALGAEKIHRVARSTDPVTYVPIYPFEHAPTHGGLPCYINCGSGITVSSHFMSNYFYSVSASEDWQSLRKEEPVPTSDALKRWLIEDNAEQMSSAIVWKKINEAARFLARELGRYMHTGFTPGMSPADYLAMLLYNGVRLTSEVSKYAIGFVVKVAKLVGITLPESIIALSISSIRSLLNRLTGKMDAEVKKALAML